MMPEPRRLTVPTRQRVTLFVVPIVIGFIAPALTLFSVQIIVGGIPVMAAITDVLFHQYIQGQNLLKMSLYELFPFVALAVVIMPFTVFRIYRACIVLCLCGLLGILSFSIPAHVYLWSPDYGSATLGKFDMVIYFFMPYYCTGALLIGLIVGLIIIKAPYYKTHPIGHCVQCGYNLTGNVSGVCPECAEAIENPQA